MLKSFSLLLTLIALLSFSFPGAAMILAAGIVLEGWPWSPLSVAGEPGMDATRHALTLSKRALAETLALDVGGRR